MNGLTGKLAFSPSEREMDCGFKRNFFSSKISVDVSGSVIPAARLLGGARVHSAAAI
jgi:hypothetical protein